MGLSFSTVVGGIDADNSMFAYRLQVMEKFLPIDYEKAERYATLQIVFHIPGKFYQLDWTGLTKPKFSRLNNTITIQIAVPKEFINDSDPTAFIASSINAAVSVVCPLLEKAHIDFDSDAIQSVLKKFDPLA